MWWRSWPAMIQASARTVIGALFAVPRRVNASASIPENRAIVARRTASNSPVSSLSDRASNLPAGEELLGLAPLVLEDRQEIPLRGDLRDVGLIVRHILGRLGAQDRRGRHATLRGPLGVPALPLAGPGNRASRAWASGIFMITCSSLSR